MAKQLLYGLVGDVIAVVDQDTSAKARKDCFRESCTSVIVADHTDELMLHWNEHKPTEQSMFKNISYQKTK
ncbi:hypothetical protein [Acinetobacter sp. P1(2025)]|uniref:hypothetical protein n=1 Tax=Acinetobacter sp. P1(2025) TaxID=3446120 RepID=UPI003F538EF2